MLATMSRVDDTVRPLRAYWGDTTADSRDQSYPSYPPPPYSTFSRDEQPLTRPSRHARTRSLTPEEIIVLTQRAVDTGLQETNRSLAGSEGVESVVRPKLTIDLGHSNIGSIPEAVVDIIKDEVAR
jgi:small subunit ribosomal protein S23